MNTFKLTQYAHAAGCGCKMAPAVLQEILKDHRSAATYNALLVGNNSNDDAAVWDLGNGQSLISTVDFFMPIVDDAFTFGRIAAANAISDVYAMGGRPLMANALLGWPVDTLPADLASQVMLGAKAICETAGIPIAGGHSIDSKEPLFGLAVNGLIQTENIKRNNTAMEGDLLFLTKPLGTGIMGTAIKRGVADEAHVAPAIESMCRLNNIGEALGSFTGVHAMTDVTGFGLLGHLLEICEGSKLGAQLYMSKIPYFNFITPYLQQNIIPDNTYRNWNAYEKKVTGINDMFSFQVLNDPQTSGGLLIAVSVDQAAALTTLMHAYQLQEHIIPIGKLISDPAHAIRVS